MGNAKGSLWSGSNAGMLWAFDHADAGILEADELPHDVIVDICRPYLGTMVSAWTDWTPLEERGVLFAEDVDRSDPWQFRNFRVS